MEPATGDPTGGRRPGSLSPVVWSEGMHLAQHHFQAQSRYFEELTSFAVASLHFRPWGLVGVELDDEALANGTVVLRHARGVMPDGMPFLFPDEPPPEPLAVAPLFSPTRTSQRLLLGIPPYRADRGNLRGGGNGPPDPRFAADRQDVSDDVTGGEPQPVPVARKNFRLLLEDDEQAEGLVTLPLARVERDGSGTFVYSPGFIPPCLRIAASPRLLQMLRRLVERLERKAATLRTERAGRSSPEAAGGDLVRFWLAHAVHSGLAPLRHHLRTGSAHPEELYGEMVRLAGALCTFAMDADPGDLPAYEHEELERTFGALEAEIGAHLEVVIPDQSLRIPLESREPFSLAALEDPRSLQRGARWFLGIRSDRARSELLRDVPRLVKVCSGDGIRKLVDRGLEGLPMRHVPSPPSSLAPRIGTEYFLLHATGPCWKLIERSRSVGIYLPGALGDAEVDLTAVLEEPGP